MESLNSPIYFFCVCLKTTHIYIPLFPMELMEKQKKLYECIELSDSQEPKIKVIKNTYSTAWGLVQEILIRKTYQSRGLKV